LAVHSIDDEEIDQCVINLHDLHGVPWPIQKIPLN
jgi:hypothetical protein